MSFLLRNGSKFLNTATQIIPKEFNRISLKYQTQHSLQLYSRSIGALSCPPIQKDINNGARQSLLCSCGCGIQGMHTKGDKELVNFLSEEIKTERQTHAGSIPSSLGDFHIKQENAELILTKKFQDEEVSISLNVNHTVDSDPNQTEGSTEDSLKSLPDFEVDIKIGSKTLSFTCQFHGAGEGEGGAEEDVFGISEMTIYQGDWEESKYCVSGDILDGVMYDLLMNMLDERGINNEFAEKLSDLCTNYEHGLYIGFLQGMQDFLQRK